jgi:hypothetical protein
VYAAFSPLRACAGCLTESAVVEAISTAGSPPFGASLCFAEKGPNRSLCAIDFHII